MEIFGEAVTLSGSDFANTIFDYKDGEIKLRGFEETSPRLNALFGRRSLDAHQMIQGILDSPDYKDFKGPVLSSISAFRFELNHIADLLISVPLFIDLPTGMIHTRELYEDHAAMTQVLADIKKAKDAEGLKDWQIERVRTVLDFLRERVDRVKSSKINDSVRGETFRSK